MGAVGACGDRERGTNGEAALNILFTGKSGSGSWSIRGEQLGAAMGATVKPMATASELKSCDLAVVVKRTPPQLLSAIRASGVRWVYDVVDAYPQPVSSAWTRAEAVKWVRNRITALRPDAVIWPTKAMADDCWVDLPSTVLYHHHRPGIAENPVRDEMKVVGYEGASAFLGEWRVVLEESCIRRGWRFVVNPPSLSDVDAVVALRGSRVDSYVTRHFKSNVKLANAHASGTPFLGQPECGYKETADGSEKWVETPTQLRQALDALQPREARLRVPKRYSVEDAAADLSAFLHAL